MPRSVRTKLALMFGSVLLATALGCGDDSSDATGDPAEASFGGTGAKEDGRFSACELLEVLKLVNESSTTTASLKELRVNSRAAAGIVKHRNGADGQLGTGDDDLFDSLDELDAIPYVGPATLDQLLSVVKDRCVIDLTKRPFIDQNTFAGSTGGGWTRDSVELEAAYTLTGIEGRKLHEILESKDSRDRTVFSRMRKVRAMEAFSYSYPIDEIPWSSSIQDVREAMPHVALTIESGRFESEGEERELSLGTDIMDDVYYDTHDYTLLKNAMTLRGRVRWDDDEVIRRILIGAKFGSQVDEEGIKQAAKIDVRNDSGSGQDTLDNDVRRGMVDWTGRDVPIEPVKEIWQRLNTAGQLPDISGHQAVLLLDGKAHIRSVRSRYHLNEASLTDIQRVFRNGMERITLVNGLTQAALDAGKLSGTARTNAEALVALGNGILDGSKVEEVAAAQLQTIGATTDVASPDSWSSPAAQVELDKQEIVAQVYDQLMHEYGAKLDELDRALTATDDRTLEDYAEMWTLFMRANDTRLAKITTAKPFLETWRTQNQSATANMDAFHAYAQAQKDAGNRDFRRYTQVNAQSWAAIERFLEYDMLVLSHRMIETAGTLANSLWFDNARKFYVPSSYRSTSNFIIDTMDYTEMITPEEWQSIPADQLKPSVEVPPEKVFHTSLVNEVQIELGSEKAYLERIEALKADMTANGETPEKLRMLEGARMVFAEYRGSLTKIAELKGDSIVDDLEDAGAPNGMQWVPATHSKGETALMILADQL